ncbi:MAG: hypothetical protein L6Q84_19315 [Polyangiaceae bacterium]|nr:hypothetical protein [Polyangiaceae bacterium]
MSLILTALVVGGGALVAGLATRYAVKKRAPAPPLPPPPPPSAPAAPSPLARAGFEIELGDVMEVLGRELWLEEAWLLSEGQDPVAALFQAREATLLVLPPPVSTLYLLNDAAIPLPAEPPTSLEAGGVRFERVRRLRVLVAPVGKSAPLPWNEGLLSEYRGLENDALWVLGHGGHSRVWQGRAVHTSDVVRWGGGAKTLE